MSGGGFTSEEQLETFLQAFPAGAIPKPEWTHRAHLAAAGLCVWRDPVAALETMRAGILRLNEQHGTANTATSGYHETLTVFWVAIVQDFCTTRLRQPRHIVINQLMDAFPSGLFRDYYSFDVVNSGEARRRWLPPDLRPLPGAGIAPAALNPRFT